MSNMKKERSEKVKAIADKLGDKISVAGGKPIRASEPIKETKPSRGVHLTHVTKDRVSGPSGRRPPTRRRPQRVAAEDALGASPGASRAEEGAATIDKTGLFAERQSLAQRKQVALQRLMHAIKAQSDWHTGLGGTTVQLDDKAVIMPSHVAELYTLGMEANALSLDNVDSTFAKVQTVLQDTQKSEEEDSLWMMILKRIDIFHWISRAQDTQKFYDQSSKAIEEVVREPASKSFP